MCDLKDNAPIILDEVGMLGLFTPPREFVEVQRKFHAFLAQARIKANKIRKERGLNLDDDGQPSPNYPLSGPR